MKAVKLKPDLIITYKENKNKKINENCANCSHKGAEHGL